MTATDTRLDTYAGRTALVTGASSGIGQAFARAYAARGANLLLTARREDRLRALAESLRGEHGVRCEVLAADLADPETPGLIRRAVQMRGLHVDILVNNAGFGLPGSFLGNDWSAHARSLQVMFCAAAELAHLFAPDMIARRWGRIVNVSSLAGHMPGTAGHTLYAPIKSALIRWSEGLHFELVGHGVHVCALCPGFTYSEFHDVNGMRAQVSRLPRIAWMQAGPVVAQGIAAVERGEPVHICGRVNRLVALLGRWLPRKAAYALVAARAKDFRRVD
ncbi:MAG: SDR family NAD(P)-dependent oxidoreductase [Gammaproteobacteria bacterium]